MEKKKEWRPKVGQNYYFITFDSDEHEFQCDEEVLESCDSDRFDMSVFPSSEECLSMCFYLNGIMGANKQKSKEFAEDFIPVGELRRMMEHLSDKDFITVCNASGDGECHKIQCVEDSTAVGFWEIRI